MTNAYDKAHQSMFLSKTPIAKSLFHNRVSLDDQPIIVHKWYIVSSCRLKSRHRVLIPGNVINPIRFVVISCQNKTTNQLPINLFLKPLRIASNGEAAKKQKFSLQTNCKNQQLLCNNIKKKLFLLRMHLQIPIYLEL